MKILLQPTEDRDGATHQDVLRREAARMCASLRRLRAATPVPQWEVTDPIFPAYEADSAHPLRAPPTATPTNSQGCDGGETLPQSTVAGAHRNDRSSLPVAVGTFADVFRDISNNGSACVKILRVAQKDQQAKVIDIEDFILPKQS